MKATFSGDASIRHGEKWDNSGPSLVSNTKFTPGPYRKYFENILTPDRAIIAVTTTECARDERNPNGHLLAAAPDLYAALEMIKKLPGFESSEPYCMATLNALKKARGE